MSRFFFTVLFALSLFQIHEVKAQIKYEKWDKEIVISILGQLKKLENPSTADLVVTAGKYLLQTPYVAHTLESDQEQLIINLREMDCTTYAENCLAFAKTVQSKNPSFDSFCENINKIRYRNGVMGNYTSRLHYFSDWIYDNAEKDLIIDVSKDIANIPYPNTVNFMSEHPKSYKQLSQNPEFLSALQDQEIAISNREYFYIPKEKVDNFEAKLNSGDIIGITTHVSGLDITHVGILTFKKGRIHLMHASSKAEEVVISDIPLGEYLQKNNSNSGIIVARPK